MYQPRSALPLPKAGTRIIFIELFELHVETNEQLELRLAIAFVENSELWFSEHIEHGIAGLEDFAEP